jgi:hypothetical protein
MGEAFVTRLDGPAPEKELAYDLLKRSAWVAPILIVGCTAIWGEQGMLSAAYAIAIVCANFALSAALLATTARISLSLMMAAALGGYLVRLGLIFLAVWLVRDAWWVDVVPLGLTLIITHLGVLFWELKHVSASLAYPGLKPKSTESSRPESGPNKESIAS